MSLHDKKRLDKKDRKGWHYDKILVCNQKERVRKYTTQRLLSTNPGVHPCLNHSTQLRPPKMYNSLTVCWILTNVKNAQELCSYTPTKQISQHVSPASPIHTEFNKRGTFSLHCRLIHILKTQAFFQSNIHRNTSFLILCTVFLSSPSAVAWLKTRHSGKFWHSAKTILA